MPRITALNDIASRSTGRFGADLQAKGELEALAALPLPENINKRVASPRERISQRAKKVNTQLNLAIGFLQDDNATGWPGDNTILQQGNPEQGYYQEGFGAEPDITSQTKDSAISQTAALTTTYDLGSETWREASVSASYSSNGESDTKYLDNQMTALGLGLTYKRGNLTLTPRASAVQIENDFVDRLGNYDILATSLGGHYQVSPQRRLTASLGQTRLSFEGTKDSNDTKTLSGSVGYEMAFAGSYLLNAGLFGQDLDSVKNTDLDKKLAGVNLSLRKGVKLGQFVTLSGAYSQSQYDNVYSQSYNPQSQTIGDGTKREDDTSSVSLSYLVLGSALSPKLANVFFTASYTHKKTTFNIVGFGQARDIANLNANYILRF